MFLVEEAKMPKSIKLLIVLAVLGFVIFSGSCRKSAEKGGIGKLTYWPSSNPWEIELATEVVDKWNKTHPNIQVLMQPLPASQSSEEVLLAAVAAKTTPDVCSNIWPGIVEQFMEAGALVPLDEFQDFQEVLGERCPEAVLEGFRSSDGHFYQIPWKGNPIMLEYNVNFLKEIGMDHPPKTYAEFWEAASKLTKDTNGDRQIDRWACLININVGWWHRFFDFYTLYIASSGGQTLVKDDTIIFNNKPAVEVFRFLQNGFRNGYFPKAEFQGNAFLQELVAMNFVGPWDIAHLERYKHEGFEYGFVPVPVPSDTTTPVVTYGDPKNMVIFSTTKHPQEAWEFVKFLITAENDKRLLEITSQIPLRKDLHLDPRFKDYFEKNPRMVDFAKQASYIRGMDSVVELKEMFDIISQEFDICCIHGRKTPEKAIEDAARRCQQILDWD